MLNPSPGSPPGSRTTVRTSQRWPSRNQRWRLQRITKGCKILAGTITGWWLTYPSEKYESQLGWLFPIYWNKQASVVSPTVATFYFYKSFSKPSLGPSLKPSPEPVEPDLALHHGFLEPSPSGTFSGTLLNLTWLCTKASQTFSVAFSGTLLNLTWLCTKASQTFSVAFSGTLLNLTWLCTKGLPDLVRNPVEPDLGLHQSLPETGAILGWRPH